MSQDIKVGMSLVASATAVFVVMISAGPYLFPKNWMQATIMYVFVASLCGLASLLGLDKDKNLNFAAMFVAFMMVFFYLGLEISLKALVDLWRYMKTNKKPSSDEKIMFIGTGYDMSHKEFIMHMWRPMLLVSFLLLDFMLYGMEGTPTEISNTYISNVATYNTNVSIPSNFTAAQVAAVPGIHSGTAWIIHGVCFFLTLTYVLPDDFKRGAYFIAVAFMFEWVAAYIFTTVVVYSPVGSAFDKRATPGCIVLGFMMSVMSLIAVTILSGMVGRSSVGLNPGKAPKNFLDILPVPTEEEKLVVAAVVAKDAKDLAVV